jgi:hypothetical protein
MKGMKERKYLSFVIKPNVNNMQDYPLTRYQVQIVVTIMTLNVLVKPYKDIKYKYSFVKKPCKSYQNLVN